MYLDEDSDRSWVLAFLHKGKLVLAQNMLVNETLQKMAKKAFRLCQFKPTFEHLRNFI